MGITERTLKKWRKEALLEMSEYYSEDHFSITIVAYNELQERVLVMTQELLDLHLIQKK